MTPARSRLGRGLAALIGDVGEETKAVERARSQRRVPIEFLRPNPRNPRRNFADDRARRARRLDARARHHPADRGAPGARRGRCLRDHRRRAALARGAARRPARRCRSSPLDVSDDEALELAIIENVQRTDLNPLEEATGYQALVDEFGHSQDDIAKIVGKSRSHVANTLRLLKLPEAVKAYHRGRQDFRRPCPHADRPARSGAAGARDRRARPQRAPGRSAGAGARAGGRQGGQGAPARRPRMPTRWRSRSGCRMRSASR